MPFIERLTPVLPWDLATGRADQHLGFEHVLHDVGFSHLDAPADGHRFEEPRGG